MLVALPLLILLSLRAHTQTHTHTHKHTRARSRWFVKDNDMFNEPFFQLHAYLRLVAVVSVLYVITFFSHLLQNKRYLIHDSVCFDVTCFISKMSGTNKRIPLNDFKVYINNTNVSWYLLAREVSCQPSDISRDLLNTKVSCQPSREGPIVAGHIRFGD